MKKLITLYESPITSYPSIANMLSMAWDEDKKILPWLADHFIQLIVRPHHDTVLDYYDHAESNNYFRNIYAMPGFSWMRNNCETIAFSKFTDYIEFIINNGYCLEPCLDRFYIGFTSCFQKYHVIHSTFIYGYDNDNQIIYIADFWDSGKYEKKEVSYEEINNSYNNDAIVNLFKYYNDNNYTFNPVLLKNSFEDYLLSRDGNNLFKNSSHLDSNNRFNDDNTCRDAIFGVNCYDYINDNFYNRDKKYLMFTPFHVLYDYRVLMGIRLDYLKQTGLYDCASLDELIVQNNQLTDFVFRLRNIVLKYDLTRRDALLERISSMLDELKTNDISFVENCLATVTQKY